MGRADYLKLGSWNAICDRCGKKRKSNDLREEWTGFMVCHDTCWEPRHVSDFYRVEAHDESVPWTRSDTDITASPTNYAGAAVAGEAITGYRK